MQHKHYALLMLSGLVALLLLVSACSMPGGSGSGSSTPQSKLTVMQVLQNSQKAMSQLKTAHVALNIKGSGQSSGSASPTTGSPIPSGTVNFSLTGQGVEALPGQEQMSLTVNQSVTNTANTVTEILSGGRLYAQFGGQWYVLNNSS